MGKHLSVGSVIDKNKISSDAVWVILLQIHVTDPNTREVVHTLRIARDNQNVIFGGEVYTAANFEIQIDQRQNQTPSVTVSAQDQTGLIQSYMEEMAGGVFSEVVMLVVNTERLSAPAEIEERFQVLNSSVKNYVVSFQLGAENPLSIQFPKHTQRQDRCAWRFRGFGCRYSGSAETCDYTKNGANGCAAKNNTMNFRALPGLVRMNV